MLLLRPLEHKRRIPGGGLEVEVAIAGPSNARIMGMRGDTDVGMDDESFRMGRDDFPMDVD